MKLVGVFRAKELAGKPGHDKRIIRRIEKNLKKFGHRVVLLDEKKLGGNIMGTQPDLVFSMARGFKALALLKLISSHVPVINAPEAVGSLTDRLQLFRAMEEVGVPVPRTRIMNFREIHELPFPYVLKALDTYGRAEDTIIVDSFCRRRGAINHFAAKVHEQALVQDFISGERKKFYAIGSDVFLVEGSRVLGVGEAELIRKCALQIGQQFALKIYGGDYIYTDENNPVFTNIYDWPSFIPIRNEAAERITDLILSYLGEFPQRT